MQEDGRMSEILVVHDFGLQDFCREMRRLPSVSAEQAARAGEAMAKAMREFRPRHSPDLERVRFLCVPVPLPQRRRPHLPLSVCVQVALRGAP